MSLDLPKLLPQVQQMSQSLLEGQSRRARQLDVAQGAYKRLLDLPAQEIEQRVAAAGVRWTGALPGREGLGESFPPPAELPGLHVLGADGSQIYPDRHAAAFFFLVNLAGIRLQHGSPDPPATRTETRLAFEPEELHYASEQPVEAAWVNLQRDLGEMTLLADLADGVRGEAALALLDNSLLLWMLLQARAAGARELDRVLADYLEAIRRLRSAGAALAGIIDRPRSSSLLALAALAADIQAGPGEDEAPRTPFPGIADRDLYAGLLPPGHRSACFGLASPLNRDFHAAGLGIHFFYLHGSEEQLLRVEVPGWVADDRALLDRVHAGLLREGRSTGGFPYVLIRAHELAVVTNRERAMVEDWIGRELGAHGLAPGRSSKSIAKTLTAGAGRRR